MRKFDMIVLLVAACTPLGCVRSTSMAVARNQALISSSAAPICGRAGAIETANQNAAIATLKQGYERFVIVSAGSENNVRVVTTGPTYSNTTGTITGTGNMLTGTANTTYGGRQVLTLGSHDAQLGVVMFNPGDPGYENALDARSTLGPDWQKKLEKGIRTCF